MGISPADLITLVIPIDLLAAYQWVRVNYTLGVPLFRLEAAWNKATPPDLERLAEGFRKSAGADLHSRLLDPGTLAMRKSLRFRWAPALRGTAVIAAGQKSIRLSLKLSWLYTVILLAQLYRVGNPGDPFPPTAYLSVFLVFAAMTALVVLLEKSKFERFRDYIEASGRAEGEVGQ